jgi:hypothetical protein
MDDGEGKRGLRRRRMLGRSGVRNDNKTKSKNKTNVKYGISRHDYSKHNTVIIEKKQKQNEEYKKRLKERRLHGGYVSYDSDEEEEYERRFKILRQEYGYSLSDEILDYMACRNITNVMKTPYWKEINKEEREIQVNEEEREQEVSEEEETNEEYYDSEEEIDYNENKTKTDNKKKEYED